MYVSGRICVVSRTWRQICHSDKAAWSKRTEFLKAVKLKIFKLGKVEKFNRHAQMHISLLGEYWVEG